jgi:hypothetical protein
MLVKSPEHGNTFHETLLMRQDSYLRNCGGTVRKLIFIPTRRTSFRLPPFFDRFYDISSFPDGIHFLLLNLS